MRQCSSQALALRVLKYFAYCDVKKLGVYYQSGLGKVQTCWPLLSIIYYNEANTFLLGLLQ